MSGECVPFGTCRWGHWRHFTLCGCVNEKGAATDTPAPTRGTTNTYAEKRSNPVPPRTGRSVMSVFSASVKFGSFLVGQQNPRPSSEVLFASVYAYSFLQRLFGVGATLHRRWKSNAAGGGGEEVRVRGAGTGVAMSPHNGRARFFWGRVLAMPPLTSCSICQRGGGKEPTGGGRPTEDRPRGDKEPTEGVP